MKTKTDMGDSMNNQEAEEFKTSKFYCKTFPNMEEIEKEKSEYVPLPKFYTFTSRKKREYPLPKIRARHERNDKGYSK